jgi:hypothetical protein
LKESTEGPVEAAASTLAMIAAPVLVLVLVLVKSRGEEGVIEKGGNPSTLGQFQTVVAKSSQRHSSPRVTDVNIEEADIEEAVGGGALQALQAARVRARPSKCTVLSSSQVAAGPYTSRAFSHSSNSCM